MRIEAGQKNRSQIAGGDASAILTIRWRENKGLEQRNRLGFRLEFAEWESVQKLLQKPED